MRLSGRTDHTGIRIFSPGTQLMTFTEQNGRFLLGEYAAGEPCQVWAQYDGFQQERLTSFTVTQEQASTASLDLGQYELQPLAAAEPSLFLLTGEAYLQGEDQHEGIEITSPGQPRVKASTYADGRYWLLSQQAGRQTWHFAKNGFTSQSLTVRPTTSPLTQLPSITLARRALQAGETRTLSGRIQVLGVASPTAEFYKSLVALIENHNIAVYADEQGQFAFAGLEPDVYSVVAWSPEYVVSEPAVVDLREADLRDLTLILDFSETLEEEQPPGMLSGVVELADRPLERISVIVGLAGTSFTSIADRQGMYLFYDVPPGSYDIVFAAEGYETLEVPEVLIESGKETIIEQVVLQKRVIAPLVILTDPPDRARGVLLDRITPLYVRFNKNMQPATVLGALRIFPEVDYRAFIGRQHALSDFNLLYIELYGGGVGIPARYGGRYTVSIARQAMDAEGLMMEEDFEFSFTLGRPSIIGTTPENGAANAIVDNALAPVTVSFNAVIDPDTLVERNFRIRPQTGGQPSITTFESPTTGWTQARIVYNWQADTVYTIEVTNRVLTMQGSRLENTPFTFNFRTEQRSKPEHEAPVRPATKGDSPFAKQGNR